MANKSGEFIHGKVLVLDDKCTAASDSTGLGEFNQSDFIESVKGVAPFQFEFSDAWDTGKRAYAVDEALRAVRKHNPDAVLLDISFGDKENRLGLDILRELTAQRLDLPVVVMTAFGKDDIWPECMQLGAVDYLPKPLDPRLLWLTLDRYVGAPPDMWLIGQAPEFLDAVYDAAYASEGGRTDVMIRGATGTGKEILARYIGRHGARAGKPFIPTNIQSSPKDLVQADLFGAKKGAYTGLDYDREGFFDLADGGVIFLDEIGEINVSTQVSLLRVAEAGEFSPLGDARVKKVDVQIVSATNANLATKVKTGEFRQDLWARLRGTALTLPLLSQRREDIPLLFRHLMRVEALKRSKKNQKVSIPEIPRELEPKLAAAPWSENIRQLRNYAGMIFDRSKNGFPSEQDFLDAWLRVEKIESSLLDEDRLGGAQDRSGTTKNDEPALARGAPLDLAGEIARLRLEELAILHRALLHTRDAVSGKVIRAKAVALLKQEAQCSTNDFDRWVMPLWNELTHEGRKWVRQQLPELVKIYPAMAEKQ